MGVAADRNAEGPCEPKVSQLELSLLVDQQILRLQISVQDQVLRASTEGMSGICHGMGMGTGSCVISVQCTSDSAKARWTMGSVTGCDLVAVHDPLKQLIQERLD